MGDEETLTQAAIRRVLDLVRRAVDPGASLEEARTSAHIACRIISTNGLTLGPPEQVKPPPKPPASPPRPPGRQPKERPRQSELCPVCRRAFGTRAVCWNQTQGYVHVRCNRPAF
jgi:hypothetical protein